MTIRITGRSDTARALVQRQPLEQSLYIPPHGQTLNRRDISPSTTYTRLPVQPPDVVAEEAAASKSLPQDMLPSPVHESEQPAVGAGFLPIKPFRHGVLWIIGIAMLFILTLVPILISSKRSVVSSLVHWSALDRGENTAILTDTVQYLFAPLAQNMERIHIAVNELSDDVENMQEMLLARTVAPVWHWQAAPIASDNLALFINLEMYGVPVEETNALVRISNLRTGQSLLVVLTPVDGVYRGHIMGSVEITPTHSDTLSVQAGDSVYAEWLTDSLVSPALLNVNNVFLGFDDSAEADTLSNVDTDGANDAEPGNDAKESP